MTLFSRDLESIFCITAIFFGFIALFELWDTMNNLAMSYCFMPKEKGQGEQKT